MEDVERLLALANLDREGLLGARVGDGDEDEVVVRAPQEAHLDAVADAAVELADERSRLVAHGRSLIGTEHRILERSHRNRPRSSRAGCRVARGTRLCSRSRSRSTRRSSPPRRTRSPSRTGRTSPTPPPSAPRSSPARSATRSPPAAG